MVESSTFSTIFLRKSSKEKILQPIPKDPIFRTSNSRQDIGSPKEKTGPALMFHRWRPKSKRAEQTQRNQDPTKLHRRNGRTTSREAETSSYPVTTTTNGSIAAERSKVKWSALHMKTRPQEKVENPVPDKDRGRDPEMMRSKELGPWKRGKKRGWKSLLSRIKGVSPRREGERGRRLPRGLWGEEVPFAEGGMGGWF